MVILDLEYIGMSMNVYMCMRLHDVCVRCICAYEYCSYKVEYLRCSISFRLHHSTMLSWLFHSILQIFSL